MTAAGVNTCALSVSGKLYLGQQPFRSVGAISRTIPIQVPLPGAVQAVDTAGHHTCALLTDGVVYLLGRDSTANLAMAPPRPPFRASQRKLRLSVRETNTVAPASAVGSWSTGGVMSTDNWATARIYRVQRRLWFSMRMVPSRPSVVVSIIVAPCPQIDAFSVGEMVGAGNLPMPPIGQHNGGQSRSNRLHFCR